MFQFSCHRAKIDCWRLRQNMKEFYEKNHQRYFKDTVSINPQNFLSPLTQQLKPKAKILDIGCGSGRDLLWLKNKGFTPTGFEQSTSLATLAQSHSGCPVIVDDFTSFDFSSLHYDALILVGSMVHVPPEIFPTLFQSICQALSSGGHILITLKEGHSFSSSSDGRLFTLWQHDNLRALFLSMNLQIIDFSRQVSRLRTNDIWLGYVLRLL